MSPATASDTKIPGVGRAASFEPRPSDLLVTQPESSDRLYVLFAFDTGVTGPLGGMFALPSLLPKTTNDVVADALWLVSSRPVRNYFFVLQDADVAALTVPTIGELLEDIRSQIDLPVNDIAALCGVKRRQFYNLLEGDTTPRPQREQHIRRLHDVVAGLADELGGDKAQTRAALLMPVGDDRRSLYDAAVSQDDDLLSRTAQTLLEKLRRGERRGMIRRPSPRFGRGGDEAGEFFSGYADDVKGEDDR